MVGWRTLTSRVFESIFFVRYDTASAITDDDCDIPSLKETQEKIIRKNNISYSQDRQEKQQYDIPTTWSMSSLYNIVYLLTSKIHDKTFTEF